MIIQYPIKNNNLKYSMEFEKKEINKENNKDIYILSLFSIVAIISPAFCAYVEYLII